MTFRILGECGARVAACFEPRSRNASCALFRKPSPSLRCAHPIFACFLLFIAGHANAQIQRSFVNLGFETPSLGTNACFVQTAASEVTGWKTTETATVANGSGCNAYNPVNGSAGNGLIELWANGYSGVTSDSGTQHAELNAQNPARLSQSVCFINGETVAYTFSHRGRSSATIGDVAEFDIDSNANIVTQASTTNNGTGGVVECGAKTVTATNGPVTGTTSGSVATPICSSATHANGWRAYTGTFVWNGTTATHNIGFAAISSSDGNLSAGNFLDTVNVTLQPVIEFASATYSSTEGQTSTEPQLLVTGTVPTGGVSITVTVAGGTATQGSDYTLGTYTIPAGTYATPTALTMTGLITVIDDSIIENNETINLQLAAGTGYVIGSTSTCGGTAQATTTYTIIDNDIDLAATKAVSTSTPLPGSTDQYTVTFTNNTAAPTLAPLTAHDATAAVADAVPANLTFTSWTCTASNGASCPGGTVNGTTTGTGAISGSASLPAGNGAAGGSVTYVVNALVPVAACGSTTPNTATITTPSGFSEGTSAQAGFTTPAPGGTANNSAAVSITPNCVANLSIVKSNGTSTYVPGTTSSFTLTLKNAGPADALGASVTDTLPTGMSLNGTISCAPAAACGANTGTAPTITLAVNITAGQTVVITIPVAYSSTPP